MRSSVPKLFHPILLIIILMLRGTSCSAQYQFQVICQKEDGQQGTVIDGKHYVGNTILWGLSDSGEPLFGASTQENPTEGDIPSTLFLGRKAISYNGVVIDGWTMVGSGYGGSMTSDGTVTYDAGLDTTKISDQQQKAFREKYLPNYKDCYYIQVAAGTSMPHIIPQHNASLPGMEMASIPKSQQMGCSCWVEGSRLNFSLKYPISSEIQLPTDPDIKDRLKTPISVDWSSLLKTKVTAVQSDGVHDCLLNKRGQILFVITFTGGDPKQNAGEWRNSAIILGTPTNASSTDEFSVRNIPDIMRTIAAKKDNSGWNEGAKLLDHWFESNALVDFTDADRAVPNWGLPIYYSSGSGITMDWLTDHTNSTNTDGNYDARVQEAYDALLDPKSPNYFGTANALKVLVSHIKFNQGFKAKQKIIKFPFSAITQNTLITNQIHTLNQSQYSSTSEKIPPLDPITATVANFSFYLIPQGEAHIDQDGFHVEIDSVAIYAIKNYHFNDHKDSYKDFFGCWGETDLLSRVALSSKYHYITVQDFQKWRMKNKKGGDYLLVSDVRIVKLPTPFRPKSIPLK